MKQAAKIVGIKSSLISAALNKRLKTAGGYRWLRYGEQPPINQKSKGE